MAPVRTGTHNAGVEHLDTGVQLLRQSPPAIPAKTETRFYPWRQFKSTAPIA